MLSLRLSLTLLFFVPLNSSTVACAVSKASSVLASPINSPLSLRKILPKELAFLKMNAALMKSIGFQRFSRILRQKHNPRNSSRLFTESTTRCRRMSRSLLRLILNQPNKRWIKKERTQEGCCEQSCLSPIPDMLKQILVSD